MSTHRHTCVPSVSRTPQERPYCLSDIPLLLWQWAARVPCPSLTLLALAPSICCLMAVPRTPIFAVVQLHRYAMLGTPAFGRLGALCRWLCRSLHLEPLGRLLDLRPDTGEVHPAQSHHDFMPVQGSLERDAHRCLWQGRRGCVRLRWCWLLRQWLRWCWSRSGMAVARAIACPIEPPLYQGCGPLVEASSDAVTVDARIAPHTSASKPCMRVSPHTAPQ
jgi:hypothetical protein